LKKAKGKVDNTVKLISWNVNGRVKDAVEQVKALGRQEPHVVALQDVRATAVEGYKMAFADLGLCHIVHTFQAIPETTPTGVLIASRFELDRLPNLLSSVLWPEGLRSPDSEKVDRHWSKRTLFVILHCPWGKIDFHDCTLLRVIIMRARRRDIFIIRGLNWICCRASIICFSLPLIGSVFSAVISMLHRKKKAQEKLLHGDMTRGGGYISLLGQIKIWSNDVSFKDLPLVICPMSIVAFMGMRTVDLKKHAVGESTASIISLPLRGCARRASATCKMFTDCN